MNTNIVRFALVGVLALSGVLVLGMATHSYLFSEQGADPRQRGETAVNTSQLIVTSSQGAFLDKSAEVDETAAPAPRLGAPAPDFTLESLDGEPVTLSAHRGTPVLLNFWATWCPPCRKEMPDLQRFSAKYGDRVQLLGVNWGESDDDVRRFLARYDVDYPNLMDRDGRAFVQYRLTGLPATFWIDERGVIRGVWEGAMSESDILNGFRKITDALE